MAMAGKGQWREGEGRSVGGEWEVEGAIAERGKEQRWENEREAATMEEKRVTLPWYVEVLGKEQ